MDETNVNHRPVDAVNACASMLAQVDTTKPSRPEAIHDIAVSMFVTPFPAVTGADLFSRSKVETVGILGSGPVARIVAKRARDELGSSILHSPTSGAADRDDLGEARRVPAAMLLHRADLICLVLPAMTDLTAWIGEQEIEQLSPSKLFLARRRCPGIEAALRYMARNFAERIRIEELAQMVALSPFHFQHRFTEILGVTPHRYQLTLRISHAKSLLRSGVAIRDVAISVGFADQSHLHRYFRQIVGVTPGQYQRRFRQHEAPEPSALLRAH